jgi:HK97 family phage prohead protease
MKTLKTPPMRKPHHASLPGAPERKDGAAGGRQVRAYALDLRAASDDGTIEGYGSVFGVRDSYDDVIAAGAFKGSLGQHASENTMPAMLWQHNMDQPIGVWTEMREDAKGLYVKGQLALDTTLGKEAHALLKMGALNGLSIGFMSKQWSYDRDTDVRTLTEIDLWEVSLVTFPANGKSRVTQVKSADELATPKDAERILRDAGFSKADATAFVSRLMRMGEQRSDSANATTQALSAADRLLKSLSNT